MIPSVVMSLWRAGLLAIVAVLMLPHLGSAAEAFLREDITSTFACQAGGDNIETLIRAAQSDPLAPPRRNGEPVDVDLGLHMEYLHSISEADHAFTLEAFVEVIWCDPRLAFDAAEAGESRKIFLEDVALRKVEEIWWPDLYFVNSSGPPAIERQELIIFSDGTVVHEQRVRVSLKSKLDLTRFPFDRQKLEIEIESFAWPAHELVLHLDSEKTGMADVFNTPPWRVTNYNVEIRSKREIRDRDAFSEFVMVVETARIAMPFVYRLMIPLVLVVIASWSVFWLRPTSTGRFGVTFTAILTVVAFNFIVTGKLPSVPELTYLEALFGLSFILLLLVVVENTIIDHLTGAERFQAAVRTDRISRVLFPLLYVASIAMVTLAFGIV
jgi:hypothetical protein